MPDQPVGYSDGPSPRGNEVPAETIRLRGRILVAEDMPDNQRLIAFILERAGAEVVLASDGRVAFELAMREWSAGRPFELILLDMKLPELDGYDVTKQLRKAGYKGPIIAWTACALIGDREKCLAAGCDDYAAKPTAAADLLGILARHLPPAAS